MSSKMVLTYYDYSKERSNVSLRGPDVNAGNFAAINTGYDDLKTAIEAVTLATLVSDKRQMSEADYPATQPASPYAQREAKWLVRYTDDADANGDGSFEIPAPDLTLLDTNGQFMNVGAGAGAALVTAIEANYRSRLGNTVNVVSIEHVGRNN